MHTLQRCFCFHLQHKLKSSQSLSSGIPPSVLENPDTLIALRRLEEGSQGCTCWASLGLHLLEPHVGMGGGEGLMRMTWDGGGAGEKALLPWKLGEPSVEVQAPQPPLGISGSFFHILHNFFICPMEDSVHS